MIIFKYIKLSINIFLILILIIFISNIPSNVGKRTATINTIPSFKLDDNSVIYNRNTISTYNITREEVLNRAYKMTTVKWIPKYNLFDKYSNYTFIKGKTYYGIPYNMSQNQITSISTFLSKIKDSKILYGNDCSGFISACWGISRQTTLSLFNAAKHHNKVDGNTIDEISWDTLKPGDALLADNGKGQGHIMLYISSNDKNKNELTVYEQNIRTVIPFVSIPTARKDIRYKNRLIKDGYIPIRLMSLK